jgi:CMP-N-acetylneuraminic acid synthetase
MQQPLVTVYITNYNYGKYLTQSVESVLGQTLQDFELLIIDDGSTDHSRTLIETYRSKPCVQIIYQQNKGLNVTNNIAMRAASGKYLMRLDADDYLHPEALEAMTQVLETDDAMGLVFPDYYYVDAQGNITGEERRHNFEKEVSLYDQPAHGACTMIRLEFLKQLGGYNESFTCQDGYDLWIKFVTRHKVTNINKPLFYYRRHSQNLTNNEERILHTRQKIKELFVKTHYTIPDATAIIPVRPQYIGGINWPLFDTGNGTVLERKVAVCAQAESLQKVVLTAGDSSLLEHMHHLAQKYPRVMVVERPAELAQTSETLSKTIQLCLETLAAAGHRTELLLTVTLDYPWLTPQVIEDVVHTQVLFKTDTVLTVRPDDRMYFQHHGHSLVPILNQNKFTRLEREALYRGAGGVALTTFDHFSDNQSMLGNSIGHVVVDARVAASVHNSFELEVYASLSKTA